MGGEFNIDVKNYICYIKHINDKYLFETGKKRLAYTHTFGCQQNVNDGEKINGVLSELGFGFTENMKDADIIIYNTCAIRENAENKVFGHLGMLKILKEEKRDLITGVCGCMTEQKHIAEKIKRSYPYIDIIFGTNAVHLLPEFIYSALENKKVIFNESGDFSIYENIPLRRNDKFKAWLPIMYGCDNYCSYCIVPYVRGRERSREPDKIVEEIKRLADEGAKDITLLGQNVNSYGRGIKKSINFSKLLKQINSVEGDFIIRFMTSHPKDATKELIDTIAECSKISKHLHLPVQSGSNKVLREMNRKYTREEYIELIDYAKKNIPELSLTSDIIVGFPSETYEDFKETLSLIEEVKFDSLYTFIYSKRNGTKASEMEDNISSEEKSKWFIELCERQREIGLSNYRKYVGKKLKIIAEEIDKDGYMSGRTENNIIVKFKNNGIEKGQTAEIVINEARSLALIGEKI